MLVEQRSLLLHLLQKVCLESVQELYASCNSLKLLEPKHRLESWQTFLRLHAHMHHSIPCVIASICTTFRGQSLSLVLVGQGSDVCVENSVGKPKQAQQCTNQQRVLFDTFSSVSLTLVSSI